MDTWQYEDLCLRQLHKDIYSMCPTKEDLILQDLKSC